MISSVCQDYTDTEQVQGSTGTHSASKLCKGSKAKDGQVGRKINCESERRREEDKLLASCLFSPLSNLCFVIGYYLFLFIYVQLKASVFG